MFLTEGQRDRGFHALDWHMGVDYMDETMQQVVAVVRVASALVLANGGETYRAEETAVRIGDAFGYEMDIIAFPTGLTMTMGNGIDTLSSIVRVNKRTTDMLKLEQVNDISRRLAAHEMTLNEASARLKAISEQKKPPIWREVAAAGGTAAGFAVMFGGGMVEFVLAGIIGALVQLVVGRLPDQEGMPLSCLVGGFMAAALTILGATLLGRGHISLIIWSIMMPMLPGLAFTNGIRDSMHGDMVSGGARISDAVMRAVVLAAGAGVAMWVYIQLGGNVTWSV